MFNIGKTKQSLRMLASHIAVSCERVTGSAQQSSMSLHQTSWNLSKSLSFLRDKNNNTRLTRLVFTGSEQKLRWRVKEAEETSRRLAAELDTQSRASGMIEAEKIDLMEAVATRDTEREALQLEVSRLVAAKEDVARERLELEIKCVQLEEERDRLEGEKLELSQAGHQAQADFKQQMLPYDQLKKDHEELLEKHNEFSKEHAEAVERSQLYDQDMLEKTRRIKEQTIELKTLEGLLHDKTKEISNHVGDIDLKQRELTKARETILNFEDVISSKEKEIESLKNVISDSSDHSNIIEMRDTIQQLRRDLDLVLEEKESEMRAQTESFESLSKNFQDKCEQVTAAHEASQELARQIAELEDVIESKNLELEEERRKTENVSQDFELKLSELSHKLEESEEKISNLAESLENSNSVREDLSKEIGYYNTRNRC